jgi:serine/threonine protein kinase
MKYIAGTSLEDVLDQKQPLSIDYVQRVLWEAACALGHAHQRGVVHRDVKPANIMFDHDGRVMLADFGISKALQAASGFTGTGMIIGTPHYMAPEQAKGGVVDGRADQYSLAVVGYRMVTGELPYTGDSVHTILYKHIFEELPRMSGKRAGTPEFLSVAIARALSKEPDQRFPTMEEFATAVWPEQPVAVPKKGATGDRSARRPVPPPVQRTASPDTPTEVTTAPTTPIPKAGLKLSADKKKRSPVGLVVGALVLAVVGAGGYLALAKRARHRHPCRRRRRVSHRPLHPSLRRSKRFTWPLGPPRRRRLPGARLPGSAHGAGRRAGVRVGELESTGQSVHRWPRPGPGSRHRRGGFGGTSHHSGGATRFQDEDRGDRYPGE